MVIYQLVGNNNIKLTRYNGHNISKERTIDGMMNDLFNKLKTCSFSPTSKENADEQLHVFINTIKYNKI